MKATGIVRRIDDLGRVVIPKEIRRTMRIREGDPLEIYTDTDGQVIFKKYSPIGELNSFAAQYADTLYKTAEMPVAICDKDGIIACAGEPKREFLERRISSKVEEVMESRSLFRGAKGDWAEPLADPSSFKISMAMPILSEGDVIGAVLSLVNDEHPTALSPDVEAKLVQTAAGFLGRQLEA